MEDKFKIYKYTNQINGKCYIGQTCRKLYERAHAGICYQECPKFYRAIKKYGWHNFVSEILIDGLSFEEANAFEFASIEYFKANKNGYNLTEGGQPGGTAFISKREKVVCIETQECFESFSQTARKFEVSLYWIQACCKGIRENANGFHFRYLDDKKHKKSLERKERRKKVLESQKKAVRCLETNHVEESTKAMSRLMKIPSNMISYNCSGKSSIAKGFHFEFVDKSFKEKANKERESRKNKVNKKKRAVYCIEKNETFLSEIEAGRKYGICYVGIDKCCKRENRTAGGLHWRFANSPPITIEEIEKGRCSIPVKLYCVETKIGFDSITQCCRDTGINRNSLRSALRDSHRTAGGLHWRFKKEEI